MAARHLSWFARYWSTTSAALLGGVMSSQTSRYWSRDAAARRLRDVQELNGAHCTGEVAGSALPPEIFIHCGTVPQAVGAHCPTCKKLLTKADATRAALF